MQAGKEVETMKALIALLLAGLLLAFGCASYGSQQQAPAPSGSGAPDTTGGSVGGTPSQPSGTGNGNAGSGSGSQVPPPPPPSGPSVKEFTVESSQFLFSPSTITVSKGDVVKITLTTADVPHGIAIPDFGFSVKASPGQPGVGQFTADKTGTYTFFCNVPCGSGHRSMKGTLIVQ